MEKKYKKPKKKKNSKKQKWKESYWEEYDSSFVAENAPELLAKTAEIALLLMEYYGISKLFILLADKGLFKSSALFINVFTVSWKIIENKAFKIIFEIMGHIHLKIFYSAKD